LRETMKSKLLRRIKPQLIAMLAITVLALSAAATASADTKQITFAHDFLICGTTLSAGNYTMVIENEHVMVKVERKVVAQCAVRWKASDDMPDSNSVLYGDKNQVIEIRFAHQHGVLILPTP
jgi:hypothetical protein